MNHYDDIIIGQGLAGTVLAYFRLKEGRKVLLIDDGYKSSSSMVAAGMWNPLVFKRLNKTWRVDEVLPLMEETYGGLEKLLSVDIFHWKNILRVIPNEESSQFMDKRLNDGDIKDYLSRELPNDIPELNAPGGLAKVQGSGWVDLPLMLKSFRKHLLSESCLLEEEFVEDQLEILEQGISYGSNTADRIIFCNGTSMMKGYLFSHLPLRFTKGEVLTLSIPDLKTDYTLNNGKFLLPVGNDVYRLGATYNWSDTSLDLTDDAKEELLSKFNELGDYSFDVLEHKAGIRPTVSDRRALLGAHENHKQVFVFNGLGTRGVMIAPWLASHLNNHLENRCELDAEVNISRFKKK